MLRPDLSADMPRWSHRNHSGALDAAELDYPNTTVTWEWADVVIIVAACARRVRCGAVVDREAENDVSLTSANFTSPWMLVVPHPSTRTVPPVMAAPAKKYDAEEASPSTAHTPGEIYFCWHGMLKVWKSSARFTCQGKHTHHAPYELR